MKELNPDIIYKMKLKFGDKFSESKEILLNFIEQNDSFSDRIIRCIIFISKDLESLKNQIEMTKIDWRDIIAYTEYYAKNNRVRNFNINFSRK